MPQRRTAIKDLRKNYKHQMHNMDIKTDIKKTIKLFVAAAEEKKTDEAGALLKTVYKKIDKATKRNLLHRKTASRRKSKFARMLAQMKTAKK